MQLLFGKVSVCTLQLIFWTVLSASWLMGQGGAGGADIVLHNGKILTVDSNFSTAEAVAISGQEFTAVGADPDILRLAGPESLVIDLKGKTAIPGLIDTHLHLHNYTESVYGGELGPERMRQYPVDWRGVGSKEDVLDQIQGLMERYQFRPGEWIYFENQLQFRRGGSVEQVKILYDELNQWELDKVTPDNPIVLSLGIPDFNGFLLNGKAMEIIMGKYGDFVRRYGRFWIDEAGRPDGHLEPPASRLLLQYLPDPAPEDVAPVYKKYLEELAATGLTTVSTRLPRYSEEAYKLLELRGELTIRLAGGMQDYFGAITDLENGLKPFANQAGSGDDKLWITSMAPTAVDGGGTRACSNQKKQLGAMEAIDNWWPTGQCHTDDEFRGASGRAGPVQDNYFRDWVFATARNGIRFANTHVAGDRSVGNLLDMIEEIQQQLGPSATQGWAFDHCRYVDPVDFPRAARLGVMFSCAPKYIEGSPDIARAFNDEVANNFVVPVKSMLDAGVKVVYEADRDMNVWHELELLMTRVARDGKVWGEQERVDRTAALQMITLWAAEYVLKPDKLGSIEAGKLADLVVLDRDYMTIPAEELSEMQPQMTVFDGKVIFVHPQFAGEYSLRPSGAVIATYEELTSRRTSQR